MTSRNAGAASVARVGSRANCPRSRLCRCRNLQPKAPGRSAQRPLPISKWPPFPPAQLIAACWGRLDLSRVGDWNARGSSQKQPKNNPIHKGSFGQLICSLVGPATRSTKGTRFVQRSRRSITRLVVALAVAAMLAAFMGPAVAEADVAAVCPAGFDLDENGATCSESVAAIDAGPACPDGTLGEPGACYVIVDKEQIPRSCESGVLTDDGCLIEGDPPTGGPGTCPDGFEPDAALGGMCARFEPAIARRPELSRRIAGRIRRVLHRGRSRPRQLDVSRRLRRA